MEGEFEVKAQGRAPNGDYVPYDYKYKTKFNGPTLVFEVNGSKFAEWTIDETGSSFKNVSSGQPAVKTSTNCELLNRGKTIRVVETWISADDGPVAPGQSRKEWEIRQERHFYPERAASGGRLNAVATGNIYARLKGETGSYFFPIHSFKATQQVN